MKIALGSDHAGFSLKRNNKAFRRKGYGNKGFWNLH